MESRQSEEPRAARFARYIEARRFDPPRPLLMKAVTLADGKEHALDAGAGALNATKYLLSAGFATVTAMDAAPRAREVAAELGDDRVTFALSRFEDFDFPASRYDLVNAEFSLPFINRGDFAATFTRLLRSVRPGGIFTGQLFGPNDSWNVKNSGMSFHSRGEAEAFFRKFDLMHFEEEDHPGTTKLGEPKHWHIFHIIARAAS
jgi:SAM-dependent methyltransferase